jgi:hypothetical protein
VQLFSTKQKKMDEGQVKITNEANEEKKFTKRKYVVSCEMFGGFSKKIDVRVLSSTTPSANEETEIMSEIVEGCRFDIVRSLESQGFWEMAEIAKKKNFHVHSSTITDIMNLGSEDDVFYICGHDEKVCDD